MIRFIICLWSGTLLSRLRLAWDFKQKGAARPDRIASSAEWAAR